MFIKRIFKKEKRLEKSKRSDPVPAANDTANDTAPAANDTANDTVPAANDTAYDTAGDTAIDTAYDPASDTAIDTANEPTMPIYEYIKTNTQDGRLPDAFRIPWQQSVWAPGSHDGVLLNHMVPLEADPNREKEILDALKLMSSEQYGDYADQIMATFEALDNEFGIVRLCSEIDLIIINHRQDLNYLNMLNFSDWILCYGISLLAIKLALTIMCVYPEPFVEEVMMEMGVYDEFTYYSVRALGQQFWLNGNDEIFTLAKSVSGWGRIHAVEWVEPTTLEIQDWLLYEGADNTVHGQYSANICLVKAGAEKRLDGPLSAKEYEAIGKLICASLESGPCRGVTRGDYLLPKYIGKAKDFQTDHYTIKLILQAADEYGLNEETIELANQLIK